MRFGDLTKDQRTEVKQGLLCVRLYRNENRTPSYGELAGVGETVSDKEAEEAYAGTEFSPDDFSCGMAADRDGVLDELKEWAERELLEGRYAEPGTGRRLTLEAKLGIDWARKALLDHIEAVRP